jgi:hypothetical protein
MAAMLIEGETKVPAKAMGTGFRQKVRPIPTARTDCGASVGGKRALSSMPAGRAPRHGAASGGRQGKGESSRQNVRPIPTFRQAASTDCRRRHVARNRSGKMITGPEMIIGAPSKLKTGSAKMITGGAKLAG